MSRPTKTQAISRFLQAKTHQDLASLYSLNMEVQVLVAQEDGTRIDGDYKGKHWHGWTDGIQTWKPFRIPLKANTEPEYEDREINFDLDRYVEAIGMTGWDWKNRLSRWVAFDFDGITGHSEQHAKRLTEVELEEIKTRIATIPWCSLRKSTGGKGYHIYVALEPVETKNHTEHAALARAILGMMSGAAQFDFSAKVDVCVPKETWVQTSKGPRKVCDLVDSQFTAIVNGEKYRTTEKGFWYTGEKEVFEIVTKEGYKFQATANHPILTKQQLGYTTSIRDALTLDLWAEVKDLKPGSKICLSNHQNLEWDGEGDFDEGYILGWLVGDGYLSIQKQKNSEFTSSGYMTNGLYLYPDDHCVLDFLVKRFKNQPNVRLNKNQSYTVHSREIEELRLKFGLDETKTINCTIESASSDFYKGFISAFFDTDGGASYAETGIELTQSDLPRVEAVQRMLLRLGVVSKIAKDREAGNVVIRGHKCKTKTKYVLRIGRENVLTFNSRIGFRNPNKISKNLGILKLVNRTFKEQFTVTVKSITSVGVKSVFDVTVPGPHEFDANGIRAKNCGGNMWVWHRKMTDTNEGLKILKAQEFLLKEIPLNWRDHLDVISGSRRKIMPSFIGSPDQSTFDALIGKSVKVPLDDQHTKLLDWFKNNNYRSWWDNDHWMLVCHTYHLKLAHAALLMRGVFETMSTGAEAPFDHNCFCFPQVNGAWSIRRYAPGVAEAKTWEQDGVGFTKCYLNKVPSLKIASRMFNGVEMTNGSYSFSVAKDAVSAAELLGTKIDIPSWIDSRPAALKEHKDGRLIVSIAQDSDDLRRLTPDSNLNGWAVEKKQYVKVLDQIQKSETEYDFGTFDEQVRHLVSAAAGEDCGWVMKTTDSEWRTEPLTHIKAYLASQGFSAKDITGILGASIGRCWYLVNKPFQEEYPSGREWNKNAAKFKFLPTQETDNLSYPTWLKVLNHCGSNLDNIVKSNDFCIQSGILTGGDYLKCWVASVFQQPTEPLPYLFFFSKAQNTGKSIFHEALSLLMTRGVVKADNALQSPTFNGELAGAVICVVEETDLGHNKQAYNKLKEWVTAKEISIRALYEAPYMAVNTTHWIQAANTHLNCPVFPGDTRITFVNVPPLNPMELIPKKILLTMLVKEAPDFLRAVLSLELPQVVDRLSLPVLSTYEKTIAEQANRSLLEEYIDDNTWYHPGSSVKFSEFFDRFKLWLDPQDIRLWSKIRVGRELPSQFPKGRVMKEDGQFYIGNMVLEQPKVASTSKPLIVINDKLTEEI